MWNHQLPNEWSTITNKIQITKWWIKKTVEQLEGCYLLVLNFYRHLICLSKTSLQRTVHSNACGRNVRVISLSLARSVPHSSRGSSRGWGWLRGRCRVGTGIRVSLITVICQMFVHIFWTRLPWTLCPQTIDDTRAKPSRLGMLCEQLKCSGRHDVILESTAGIVAIIGGCIGPGIIVITVVIVVVPIHHLLWWQRAVGSVTGMIRALSMCGQEVRMVTGTVFRTSSIIWVHIFLQYPQSSSMQLGKGQFLQATASLPVKQVLHKLFD